MVVPPFEGESYKVRRGMLELYVLPLDRSTKYKVYVLGSRMDRDRSGESGKSSSTAAPNRPIDVVKRKDKVDDVSAFY